MVVPLVHLKGHELADTKEQTAAYVASLLAERAGYEAKGLDERVAAVDAELRRLGQRAVAPAKRAEKRPAAQGETR